MTLPPLLRDRERSFFDFLEQGLRDADSAHDLAHLRRVVNTAVALARLEGANVDVVHAAAWLHDCVQIPKDSDDRAMASRLAAETASPCLEAMGFTPEEIAEVRHAIEAHSFSAGIPPRTQEAKVVQDADRLDALGAIGIARCLLVGGQLGRSLMAQEDPFCNHRPPDDSRYTLDHFPAKLLRLSGTMQTEAGRREAERRTDVMRRWLSDLAREVDPSG